MADMVSKYKSVLKWRNVKILGGHQSGVDRYVTKVSAKYNGSMYPETVTLQNGSSKTERTVEVTTLATRVKVPPPHVTR